MIRTPRAKLWLASAFVFGSVLISGNSARAADDYAELEYSHASLTSGFSDWNDVNLLNYIGLGKHQLIIETDYKHHFDESAFVVGVTDSYTYDAKWYQDFSVSTSTDASIVPGLAAFTEIHRKLLSDESLIPGLGVGHNISQSPYNDTFGLFELSYYLNELSFTVGYRLNNSNPGDIITHRGYGVVAYTTEKWDAFVRFETGREGYSVLGDSVFRNEFSSHDESAQFRYWLNKKVGVGARIDSYESDIYNRNLVALDLLWHY